MPEHLGGVNPASRLRALDLPLRQQHRPANVEMLKRGEVEGLRVDAARRAGSTQALASPRFNISTFASRCCCLQGRSSARSLDAGLTPPRCSGIRISSPSSARSLQRMPYARPTRARPRSCPRRRGRAGAPPGGPRRRPAAAAAAAGPRQASSTSPLAAAAWRRPTRRPPQSRPTTPSRESSSTSGRRAWTMRARCPRRCSGSRRARPRTPSSRTGPRSARRARRAGARSAARAASARRPRQAPVSRQMCARPPRDSESPLHRGFWCLTPVGAGGVVGRPPP